MFIDPRTALELAAQRRLDDERRVRVPRRPFEPRTVRPGRAFLAGLARPGDQDDGLPARAGSASASGAGCAARWSPLRRARATPGHRGAGCRAAGARPPGRRPRSDPRRATSPRYAGTGSCRRPSSDARRGRRKHRAHLLPRAARAPHRSPGPSTDYVRRRLSGSRYPAEAVADAAGATARSGM